MINYSRIANDAQIPTSTVREYFQILKDTFLAYELPAWRETVQRKPISTSKFFFFDGGLARSLQGRRSLSLKSPEAGEASESYIFHELKSYCDYKQIEGLSYWRSTSKFEVDFILADKIAIEVKAKTTITPRGLKGPKALREEDLLTRSVLVSLESRKIIRDGIEILPWEDFLEELWEHAAIHPDKRGPLNTSGSL